MILTKIIFNNFRLPEEGDIIHKNKVINLIFHSNVANRKTNKKQQVEIYCNFFTRKMFKLSRVNHWPRLPAWISRDPPFSFSCSKDRLRCLGHVINPFYAGSPVHRVSTTTTKIVFYKCILFTNIT